MNNPPKFQKHRNLSELCTLGIGGPATYFIEVTTTDELSNALIYCKRNSIDFFILGKGSNTLFHDQGFNGAVIHNKIDHIKETSPGIFEVGAGFNFSRLGTLTARNGWTGLEFASGIPGSVGGAVFMNAGANGSSTSDCLSSVTFMDSEGKMTIYNKSDLNFSYRFSSFQKMAGAIVSATFTLTPSETARKKQINIITYRKETQPYGEKSAGCVFRNPDCGSAGALIDKCGLKGLRIGGAEVSDIHANFLINTQDCKSEDFLNLIQTVKEKVKNQMGVELECEVRYIPWTHKESTPP